MNKTNSFEELLTCLFIRRMEPLKNMFNPEFIQKLAVKIKSVYPQFDSVNYTKEVLLQLQGLELNQRLRLISSSLRNFLPDSYSKSLTILKKTAPTMQSGYTALIYPDFVGLYGKAELEKSIDALKYFTVFGSSEFAIREFLKHDFQFTLNEMKKWTLNENEHVRRLASEGSRPRLPWSFKLDEVIKKPEHTFPLLDKLKVDPSLYVRKSVANHLNDISKDHPEKLLRYIKGWNGDHPHTLWIMKRACRTLIKKGNKESLHVFNFEKQAKIKISNLKLSPKHLKIGDALQVSFDLTSQKNKTQKLVIDYVVHYLKPSGALLPKVFKLKEISLPAGQSIHVEKKHSFKHFSTRTQYAGKHLLEIQINGISMAKSPFYLNE